MPSEKSPRGQLRLLYIASDAPFFVTHFLPLASAALRQGYEVHVATPLDPASGRGDHAAQERIVAGGLIFHEISLKRENTNPLKEFGVMREFARLISGIRPDIMHCIGIKPVLYAGAIARLRKIPSVHAVIGLGLPFMGQGLVVSLRKALLLRGFSFAFSNPRSRVTVEHEEDRDVLISAHAVKDQNLHRLYGVGVDLAAFHPIASGERSADAPPVIMFAARLIEPKGVRDFVAAAQRIKRRNIPARFVLQCQLDLSHRNAISEAEVKDWHAKQWIEWWGYSRDMPNALRKADIFCFPTYYREGTPKVLLEAAASGLPIITTNVPGCRDVVQTGDNGVLVTPRNVDELEEAILELLCNPALRQKAGRRSREIAVERFSLESYVKNSMDLYVAVEPRSGADRLGGAPPASSGQALASA